MEWNLSHKVSIFLARGQVMKLIFSLQVDWVYVFELTTTKAASTKKKGRPLAYFIPPHLTYEEVVGAGRRTMNMRVCRKKKSFYAVCLISGILSLHSVLLTPFLSSFHASQLLSLSVEPLSLLAIFFAPFFLLSFSGPPPVFHYFLLYFTPFFLVRGSFILPTT